MVRDGPRSSLHRAKGACSRRAVLRSRCDISSRHFQDSRSSRRAARSSSASRAAAAAASSASTSSPRFCCNIDQTGMSTGKGLPSLARSRRSRSVSSRSACWLAVPRRLTAGRPAGRTPVGSHAWSAFGATPCDLRRRSSDSSRATWPEGASRSQLQAGVGTHLARAARASASAVAREDAIRRWVCSAARSRRRVSAAASCDARSAARLEQVSEHAPGRRREAWCGLAAPGAVRAPRELGGGVEAVEL